MLDATAAVPDAWQTMIPVRTPDAFGGRRFINRRLGELLTA
jgi:hypothetical protein